MRNKENRRKLDKEDEEENNWRGRYLLLLLLIIIILVITTWLLKYIVNCRDDVQQIFTSVNGIFWVTWWLLYVVCMSTSTIILRFFEMVRLMFKIKQEKTTNNFYTITLINSTGWLLFITIVYYRCYTHYVW